MDLTQITATPVSKPGPSSPVPDEAASAEPVLLSAHAPDSAGPTAARCKPALRLFVSIALLGLALITLNVAIWRTSKSSQRQQLLARLENLPTNTDLLFLGNSLVEAGFDVDAFSTGSAGKLRAENIALGATTPVEHYLILRQALAGPVRPKTVVYGFFDDQLFSPVRGDWEDLVGNRALSYYHPAEAADLYAPGSGLKLWELKVGSAIPMLSERSSLWGKVELLRRKLESIGMPPQRTTRFGRVGDFAAAEAQDAATFDRRCAAAIAQPSGFSRPIQKIIGLCHQHGINLIFIEMPMPMAHRKLFYSSEGWASLSQHLNELSQANGISVIRATDWVADARFEDATHLDPEGAKILSARLASTLAEPAMAAAR